MKNPIGHVRRHWNQKHKREGLLRKGAHHLFFIEDEKRRSLNYLCDAGFRQKEGLSGRRHSVH